MAEPGKDEDDKWLEALSGRRVDDMAPGLTNEIQVLRRVLRSREEAELRSAGGFPGAEERGLHALLFRLRGERLLEARGLRRFALPLALAASVAIAIALVRPDLISTGQVHYDEPPAYRGALTEQTVAGERPKEDAERLAAALKTSGISARLYQRGKEFLVDFSVAGDQVERAGDALKPLGVTPRSGDHRIVFRPR